LKINFGLEVKDLEGELLYLFREKQEKIVIILDGLDEKKYNNEHC
jgi:hypothetical protein